MNQWCPKKSRNGRYPTQSQPWEIPTRIRHLRPAILPQLENPDKLPPRKAASLEIQVPARFGWLGWIYTWNPQAIYCIYNYNIYVYIIYIHAYMYIIVYITSKQPLEDETSLR